MHRPERDRTAGKIPVQLKLLQVLRVRSCRHGSEPLPSISRYLAGSSPSPPWWQDSSSKTRLFSCVLNSLVEEVLTILHCFTMPGSHWCIKNCSSTSHNTYGKHRSTKLSAASSESHTPCIHTVNGFNLTRTFTSCNHTFNDRSQPRTGLSTLQPPTPKTKTWYSMCHWAKIKLQLNT